MRYEKRIDVQQGDYLVTDSTEFESILQKIDLEVGEITISPETFTDLYGWFNKPCKYVGMLENNEAIFYLGSGQSDLFSSGGEYYDITYIFAKDRIGKCYKRGTFRDNFLVRNKKGFLAWK